MSVVAISGKQILEAFAPDVTIGQVLDTVSRRLAGGDVWYRGEAKLYPTPALPVLARTPGVNLSPLEPDFIHGSVRFPLRVMTLGEEAYLKNIQAAHPPDPYFYKLISSGDDPAWFAMARHQGFPTRLLDVTSDIRVALYFACCEHQSEEGFLLAYVDLWNPEKNRSKPITHYADLFDAALGDSIPTYREAERTAPGTLAANSEKLAASISSRADMAYLFECTAALNERMTAQQGAFIWRGDPTKDLLEGIANVFPFQISGKAKDRLLSQLSFLKINRQTLKL